MDLLKGITHQGNVLKHVTLDGIRLHLKTDEKKLWINGYYVLYLNDTANNMLAALIDSCYEVSKEQVMDATLKKVQALYPTVSRRVLEGDIHSIIGIVNSFARNDIPSNMVGMKVITKENMMAPNRMDLSLIYRCNNNCGHCYLPDKSKAEMKEMSTESWKKVMDILWGVGIPQIAFTGGECTLREDLVELVAYGKEFVTGIISNGTNITSHLAHDLRKAELDWIQITLESDNPVVHDSMQGREGAFEQTLQGIKNCVSAGLQVSINATITSANRLDLIRLINMAEELGVQIVSTNAIIRSGRGTDAKDSQGLSETELEEILRVAKDYAHKKGITFNWFLPTCYKKLNPLELGFGQRCCSACSVNMMVEPDGDVIPCQSWVGNELGNILYDSWETIWGSSEAEKIRGFGYAPEECRSCEHFQVCGGACPLDKINCGGCGK